MHIVIVGVGGVGGFFGGKLIQSGCKVTLIARGVHKKAILAQGLHIKSVDGDFNVHPHLVTDDVSRVEPADLILLCTKSWQVKQAANQIKHLIKENTLVLPLQNGADNAEKVLEIIDKKHVIGGLCKIYSKIEAPGIINHFGFVPEIIFGALHTISNDRLEEVSTLFDKAKIKNKIAKDIQVAIWQKFLFIATVSGLGGLTRATLGVLYEDKNLRDLLERTAQEICAVAQAKHINLPEDSVSAVMNIIKNQPYDATASTQRDIMEGRPSELENFNGFMVREGERLGVPTPVNSFIYYCLMPMEKKARA
ncbi:ketopantoate reductase family protein [Aquimarina intermedia]|uniref:2-dehydropantoate 2-reductase n=1 Tax=Aquimarina intermedia TaxID=350814 RepID=A0A5S5CFT9_9FLAO|nr:2-dehydropantoate 2-reductase [Aquimarina intermedia]TYP77156.1 ketopantoate reductase [Aquimarina intermedia]